MPSVSPSGCAALSFDSGAVRACPQLAEQSRELQEQAVEALALLPEGSAVAEMLSDYAVIWEQARVC